MNLKIRDQFAIQILNGLICSDKSGININHFAEENVEKAYTIANLMMKERAKNSHIK